MNWRINAPLSLWIGWNNFNKRSKLEYDQNKALEEADFVYLKTGPILMIMVKSYK